MDMKKFGFMLLTACLGGVITLGAYKLVETKITDSTSLDDKQKVYFANNPLCVRCKKNGLITPGKDVDHITPIRLGGEIYDYDNLQTLCKPCHNRKSGKEAHMK